MNPIEQDRLIQQELANFQRQTVVEGAAFPRDVQSVLCSIHEHLFDPRVNVSVLLDRCTIRSARIYARFKCYLKMSIRQYLEHQRMLAAMDLLERDELDLASIAFSVGYANYEAFSRAFRRRVGCTPGAYRKKTSEEIVNASEGEDGVVE